jgi:hypothetical protein
MGACVIELIAGALPQAVRVQMMCRWNFLCFLGAAPHPINAFQAGYESGGLRVNCAFDAG